MLNIAIPDPLQSFVEQQATDAGLNVSGYVLDLIHREQQRVGMRGIDQPMIDRETDPILLMKLPLADRRKILAAQADVMAVHYEQDHDWREFMAGDFIDY
jgi:hypothetical protein